MNHKMAILIKDPALRIKLGYILQKGQAEYNRQAELHARSDRRAFPRIHRANAWCKDGTVISLCGIHFKGTKTKNKLTDEDRRTTCSNCRKMIRV